MKLKAILIGLLAACLLAVVGCGSNSTPSQSTNSDKDSSQSTKKDTKNADMTALTGFELDVIEDMHVAIKPVNDLVSLSNAKSFNADAVKTSAEAAAKSADDYATKIKGYSLPSGMSSATKTKVKAALADLATSFQQRADAAKACENVTSQAELNTAVAKIDTDSKDSFQSFEDKMNAVHSDLGMLSSDFSKELQ
ncbi:hypothetical protein PU629_20330 [Pullulanibacillus sp. KACC 23026]|uniref:hypothetical protein n=1 Tax=Pullulanibacillus sp. KACC 23026 TaxID=3028315 RepID=UPI0023AF8967|nr:hypothetical protein [Pullulanibacillus sp. KACC 23026]WEG12417.1 hypothetical protein PU629_20330 [Pullulanibacillus sp. KACC 23026]